MNTNLDTLKSEIQAFLENEGFVVFHGYPRPIVDTVPVVYWDADRRPDYTEFLQAAKAAGVTMIVFHQREFGQDMVDEAMDRLEGSGLNREDYKLTERRLEELRRYEGFTCAIELSFDFQTRVYIYELHAEWYQEFSEILDELDFGDPGEPGEEEDPMGGYFSKN
jgi:hypothetical protein